VSDPVEASGTSASARRRVAQVVAVVAALILLVWLILRPHPLDSTGPPGPDRPDVQAVTAGSVLKPKPCFRAVHKPFVPTRITVPGVTRNAQVLALPRDAEDVPSAPAISSLGKTQFAWDAPTIKPGEPKGNVLLNAHTWPDGTALGNHLLDGLHVGDKIIVHGAHATLCYRVTKRVVIAAADGSWEYYDQTGRPQIALIVCSPPRLGPGNWQNRTIWYASPMTT
jgi:hypothetical protein